MRDWPAEKIITAFRIRNFIAFFRASGALSDATRGRRKPGGTGGADKSFYGGYHAPAGACRTKQFWYPATAAATRGILNSIRSFELADFWHGGVPKNCSVALIRCGKLDKPSLIYENRTFIGGKYENIRFLL